MANLFTLKRKGTDITIPSYQGGVNLILPADGDSFNIYTTGAIIEKISGGTRAIGSRVILRCMGTLGFFPRVGPITPWQATKLGSKLSDYKNTIVLAGDHFDMKALDTICFEYSNTGQWVELYRNAVQPKQPPITAYPTQMGPLRLFYIITNQDMTDHPSDAERTMRIGDTIVGPGGEFVVSKADTVDTLRAKLVAIPAIGSASNISISINPVTATRTEFSVDFIGALLNKPIVVEYTVNGVGGGIIDTSPMRLSPAHPISIPHLTATDAPVETLFIDPVTGVLNFKDRNGDSHPLY